PELVASTIAQAFGIWEMGSASVVARLEDYLRAQQILLVLDNFAQRLAAAPLVGELLAAAPRLKVLVTSRVVLRLYGEREFAVPPLGLPPQILRTGTRRVNQEPRTGVGPLVLGSRFSVLPSVAELTQYEAVRL